MSEFRLRIGQLSEVRRRHISQLRANCAANDKDKTGSASNSLAGTLRFLAVADFVLSNDVEAFRRQLLEAAKLRQSLLERFDTGEPISPSYVSMIAYKALFNALASADKSCVSEFALRMGGREGVELEYDRPFDMALGYALKALILFDDAAAACYLDKLDIACMESENSDFVGYAKVLRAILNHDDSCVSDGFAELVVGHKRQCKKNGLFKDTEDEVLCVWGVGLANLARMRGLVFKLVDPLIPENLLFVI